MGNKGISLIVSINLYCSISKLLQTICIAKHQVGLEVSCTAVQVHRALPVIHSFSNCHILFGHMIILLLV
jgi:hypothetical protein